MSILGTSLICLSICFTQHSQQRTPRRLFEHRVVHSILARVGGPFRVVGGGFECDAIIPRVDDLALVARCEGGGAVEDAVHETVVCHLADIPPGETVTYD